MALENGCIHSRPHMENWTQSLRFPNLVLQDEIERERGTESTFERKTLGVRCLTEELEWGGGSS